VASSTHIRFVVDHTLPTQLQIYIKLKITHSLILSTNVFSLSSLHLLSKKHLKQSFCYTFVHSQQFNEMFIVSGKSWHFYGCPFYIVANKEYLMKRQIIFRCVNSELSQLYCLKCSFKSVDISRCYARKQQDCFFFWNTVYYLIQCCSTRNSGAK